MRWCARVPLRVPRGTSQKYRARRPPIQIDILKCTSSTCRCRSISTSSYVADRILAWARWWLRVALFGRAWTWWCREAVCGLRPTGYRTEKHCNDHTASGALTYVTVARQVSTSRSPIRRPRQGYLPTSPPLGTSPSIANALGAPVCQACCGSSRSMAPIELRRCCRKKKRNLIVRNS